MKYRNLHSGNRSYYARYYRLIALASLIMAAVLVGSLVIGESVRTTLVKRVDERLGSTETLIFSRNSFMDKAILQQPVFKGRGEGVMLTNGFVSVSGKLVPVTVWGVEDNDIPAGHAQLNEHLAGEIAQGVGSELVLRLPATGLVPSGSIFVTENYTTSLRLQCNGVKGVNEGGNRNLKNEQALPFNVFVNQTELTALLETTGKINLILSPDHILQPDFDQAWNYTYSGLKTAIKNGYAEISSDRIFMQQEVVETIYRQNPQANRLFSYLINSISIEDKSIPYSFVTALDSYQGIPVPKDQVILSDYAAGRLQAIVGDTVQFTYYTSHDLKVLSTDTLKLCVSRILPLAQFRSDSTLSANFPGLSNVENCTDWDSDLPINMTLISKQDEAYWDVYQNTPKALIAYEAAADSWSNSYGSATAVRTPGMQPDLRNITPAMLGIQLSYPKQAGISAASNGVDFSGLFLALGFFIILSAILLMLVPLSEMMYQRRHETALLRSVGFSLKRIVNLIWKESVPVVFFSSLAGIVVGLLYTYVVMWLLGNVWKGATHTDGFAMFPTPGTLLTGLIAGLLIGLPLLRIFIVKSLKESRSHKPVKSHMQNNRLLYAVIASVLMVAVIIINGFYWQSAVLFMLVGVVLIGTAALWGNYLIGRKVSGEQLFHITSIIQAALQAERKQTVLSFFTLSMGVFIVFSVGLNRKGFSDASQTRTGTGGYTLWCESSVPVYHRIATEQGREKLALHDLPDDAHVIQLYKYDADDASCLNLNKVSNPSVLGVEMDVLQNSDFEIEQSLYKGDKVACFQQLQEKSGSLYPVLVDAGVLTWGLGLKLGDTLRYENSKGEMVQLQLAGTLKNSIFQGNVLMDKKLFSEIWGDITGSRIMLFQVPQSQSEQTRMLVSQALSNYGVRVSTTADRLKEFYSVTDTYLTIFMTLGGLGLLLGIVCFIIVIRKNLLSRKKEIALYRSLGFTPVRIAAILYRENRIVPLYAIAVGIVAALVGVSAGITNISSWIWLLGLILTILFVTCVLVFIRKSVWNIVSGQPR